MLAGLYYNWNMPLQHPASHPAALAGRQGVAPTASQQGAPGSSGATGDWRSVVQAAAAAASQLEISKLSGSKSLRSADLADSLPLATPSASLGKAQTAPAAKLCAAQLPARFSKVILFYLSPSRLEPCASLASRSGAAARSCMDLIAGACQRVQGDAQQP